MLTLPYAISRWTKFNEKEWEEHSSDHRKDLLDFWKTVEEVVSTLEEKSWVVASESYSNGVQVVIMVKNGKEVELAFGE